MNTSSRRLSTCRRRPGVTSSLLANGSDLSGSGIGIGDRGLRLGERDTDRDELGISRSLRETEVVFDTPSWASSIIRSSVSTSSCTSSSKGVRVGCTAWALCSSSASISSAAPKAADRLALLWPRKGLIIEKISRSIIGELVLDVGVLGPRMRAEDDGFVGVLV